MTVALLVALFVVYAFELGLPAHGWTPSAVLASPSLATMVAMGAQVGAFVLAGQWWRIVTAMFLHFNGLHIATNAWSLYVVGGLIEPYYGSGRFTVLYFASGVLGGLFLLALTPPDAVGAGASGAIFGLLGATVVLGLLGRGQAGRSLLSWSVTIFALNIAFDLFDPAIAVWDHVGGFLGGLLIGWWLGLPGRRPRLAALGLLLYLALGVWLLRRALA